MQCSIRFTVKETALRQIHAFRLDGDVLTQIVATLSEYDVPQMLDQMVSLVRGFRGGIIPHKAIVVAPGRAADNRDFLKTPIP